MRSRTLRKLKCALPAKGHQAGRGIKEVHVSAMKQGTFREFQGRAIFALLTAAALFSLLMSACGGGGGSAPPPTSNPIPSITSLSPASVTAGSAAQSLTINGTNFMPGSTVTYNSVAHTATYVSSTQLTISLSASDQSTAGTCAVVVTNPSPGGGPSNSVNFTVGNPVPAISNLSPATLAVGSPPTTITVDGSNFVSTSQILLNGGATTTNFVSPSQLTASVPASYLASGNSVSVAVSSPAPGGGTSSPVAIQLLSIASLAMLAVPSDATAPDGPWMATVLAQDASRNPIPGLPITVTATQGSLSASQGSTDSNGAFQTSLTPPAGMAATQAVGLTATIGGQSVSTTLAFTGISAAQLRRGNSAARLRAQIGVKASPQASTVTAAVPVAIGISAAAPGSTTPFAAPSSCYTFAALSATETAECAAQFQAQNISLEPSNPFQAGCQLATIANTAIGIGECVGTAVTVISCATSATGIGSIVSAGTSDAVCVAMLELPEPLSPESLAEGCAEFILGELTQWFSPPAATAEELVELSVEPSDNPLDYVVAYCDLANSGVAPSSGIAVAPVAGNGYQGFLNGPALGSELNSPTGIAIDRNGNVYFDDDGNNVIRELSSAPPQQVTTFAGTGAAGYTGDNGPASAATLNHPAQLAFDVDYNLYIADTENNVIREISRTGTITTVAGTGTPGFNGDNQAATQAMLSFPDSLAFDAAGNLYIADAENNRIRMVSGNGVISTVAGTGTAGYNGDNIAATDAWLNFPSRIVLDPSGNMYIADCHNNRVRLVNRSTGIITTIAGNGTAGYQGNGSAAANAELNNPLSIALDASGNVYIADLHNQVIRVVNMQSSPATLSGVTVQPGTIATVVGGGPQSDTTPGPALSVALGFPTGLLVDPAGNLYFADADYNLILKVTNAN